MIGYVYIMVNTAFPELIKIGRTTKSSDERASELYTTGTPSKFVVVYDVLVDNCEEIEKELHQYYSNKRYSNNREFFQVSAKDAITKLQEVSQGRLATSHTSETINSVDKELCDGNLVNLYFYHSKIIFYNTDTSAVSWSNSESYKLHRYGIFHSESSDPERMLTSNLKKYYFEQGKFVHAINGVKIINFWKINSFPVNEKKKYVVERLLGSALEKIIMNDIYSSKFMFIDDKQTLAYKNDDDYDGFYEFEVIFNNIKETLLTYFEREEESYLSWHEELIKEELKKSWAGKI